MNKIQQQISRKRASRRAVMQALGTGGALAFLPSLVDAAEEPGIEFQDCREVSLVNPPDAQNVTLWTYYVIMWYPPDEAAKVPWESRRVWGVGTSSRSYSVRPYETIVAAEIVYGGSEQSVLPFINPNGCAKQLIKEFNVRIEDGRVSYDELDEPTQIPPEPPNAGNPP